jgi:hypothetical protein
VQYQNLREAVYFAPRGKKRLVRLGHFLAQHYLHPDDGLIGFMGASGMGKSSLIRGMFPGLELTNDDENVNVRPLPLLRDLRAGSFRSYTYHLDVRFEMAFVPLTELAISVERAVLASQRVVVEHFEILAPVLPINAALLVGIGEEVVVCRPTLFGPPAVDIASRVHASSYYRKMVHTAEDLTTLILFDLNQPPPVGHGDLPHGFILEYETQLAVDLATVESKVKEIILAGLPVTYYDEGHIKIGDRMIPCTGPRIHLSRTSDILGFSLKPQLCYEPLTNRYLLVGTVSTASVESGG